MNCRFCKTTLQHEFINLGNAPASNSFLTADQLNKPEVYYPLKVFVCHQCFLVQIDEYQSSESIFNDEYVYFSSYSTSWLNHARQYTEMMTQRFALGTHSSVMEIASNDGYLLQYFAEKNIPVTGIEPTKNTAEVALGRGIPTIVDFFGTRLAAQLVTEDKQADLLVGNNVLAHVPDIVDFVAGMKIVLKPGGIITLEFPHLVRLIDGNQFDTIYHEHYSYLSFYTVKKIFAAQQLEIFDVEELATHGGSLRIFARHAGHTELKISPRVGEMEELEQQKGVTSLEYYTGFQQRALKTKLELLDFLIKQKVAGKKVAAYGAAAKGNTLLNYCGIKSDLIDFVVDANPNKQNKFLPASHIPVKDENHLKNEKSDYVIILPWNLKEEIMHQLEYIHQWGGKFVLPIPSLTID